MAKPVPQLPVTPAIVTTSPTLNPALLPTPSNTTTSVGVLDIDKVVSWPEPVRFVETAIAEELYMVNVLVVGVDVIVEEVILNDPLAIEVGTFVTLITSFVSNP